jgi:hypothetical protein
MTGSRRGQVPILWRGFDSELSKSKNVLHSPVAAGGNMRLLKLALSSMFAVLVLSAGAARSAEPMKTRIAWQTPINNWASILLDKKGLANHLEKPHVLEPVHYITSPLMITALANGDRQKRPDLCGAGNDIESGPPEAAHL